MEEQLLWIDLSASSYRTEAIPGQVTEDFLGGRGLGAYLLYHNLPPNTAPLSPANLLIFSIGPAQGADTLYSPKTVLTTKSPLTNIYLYSVASGSFGHSLRRAGFTSLIISGKAPQPTFVTIHEDGVEFRSARNLWGKMTGESQKAMCEEVGVKGASTVVIGPAGEKGVEIADIVGEGDHYRTFGRGGAGCVMGSKNLKGIVVWGKRHPGAKSKEDFARLKEVVKQRIKDNPAWAQRWTLYGTGASILSLDKLGILPTRNWQTGVFEGKEGIDVSTAPLLQQWPRKLVACGPYCPNPCSHRSYVGAGPYAGAKSEGPEYETIYSMGSNCGIDRLDAIIAAEEICDEYGLDTMSTGVSISFAMECYEKGLITKKDTDGIDLRFGNHEAMVAMVRRIGNKEGLGELLGHGVRKASQSIPGSEAFAMHTKGLELGGYEPRGAYGQALAYALSSIGGSHSAIGLPARVEAFDGTGLRMDGKGQLLKEVAIDKMVSDSAILCHFARTIMDPDFVSQLLLSLTGKEISPVKLEKIGMRIITLERLFNVRDGLTREDDTLPSRLLNEPMPAGRNQGSLINLEPLKDDGYRALGWDESGVPRPELLKELGLPAFTRSRK